MSISRTDSGKPHGSQGGKKGAEKRSEGPRLGTTAKSVGHFSEDSHENKAFEENRSARFRHQRHAAKLLKGKGRVGLCRWSVVSKQAGVDMVASSYGDDKPDRVHFEGLQTCGSVWACPCCSKRISETRRDEMNQLLSWSRSQGYKVSMITLTARHGRDDELSELLEQMKDAKRRWAQHRRYKNIKPLMIGSITATEVTGGGANGWHPHFHMIIVTETGCDLEPLRDAWLAGLRGAGLDGAGAAFQVQNADQAGSYIAKWGAAEELALKDHKKGRAGRTPAQLLAASCDDQDRVAGMLWAEYADVFHGRRQLVWSRGLKDLAGINEVDDQEAANDEQQEGQVETGRANLEHEVWKSQVATRKADRRSDVLDRAEEVGPEAAAAEITAGHVPDVDVIEELFEPRPGGLAEAALKAMKRPDDGLDASPGATELPNFISEIGNSEIGGGVAVGHEDFQSTALPPSSKHVEKPPPEIAM